MEVTMAVLAVFSLAVLASFTSGSVVTFEKTPDIIQTILTKQMTLTCAVNDTSPSGSLVGRRSVTQTSTNVQYVTSMVVLRGGVEVATVTPFSPATAMQDKNKLNVTGSVPGTHGERGYLTLTWYYPDEIQSGNYTCEVNGIGLSGHGVSFAASLVMPSRTPNMADIIQHVHDQEIRIEEQTIKNKDLQKQIDNQNADITSRVNKMATMESTVARIENEMTQMAGFLNESRHFENGTVVCGGSSTSWSIDGTYRSKEMTVQFQSPYTKSPIVQISPVHVDYYHRHASTNSATTQDFWIDLLKVTDSNFTVRCRSRNDRSNYHYLNNLALDWISVP